MYLTTETNLTALKCWCGIEHAVPKTLRNEQLRQNDNGINVMGIYCPLGHSHVPSRESRCKKLERLLSRERANHDQTLERAKSAERSAVAYRGHLTRNKRRIGNGTCPCCNRHFTNVERHMKSKHPEYAQGESADA